MKIDLQEVERKIRSGLVDQRIFHDEDIYRLEMKRIFGKGWLFLGHASMIPDVGDYITTYMGETPVIVSRGNDGSVKAFINRCSHRGLHLCPYDRGTAKRFICPYHGWTYSLDGELTVLPSAESFPSDFDSANFGLISVPRVQDYKGFIFGNLDRGAPTFEEYLGDLKYYFDYFMVRDYVGGVVASPIKQRVISRHNWKIPADNGSDNYHATPTHGGAHGTIRRLEEFYVNDLHGTMLTITNKAAADAGHTVATGRSFDNGFDYDLAMAEELGEDCVAYIRRRYERARSHVTDLAPGQFCVMHVFPGMLQVDLASVCSVGTAMEVWHPKGPTKTETWIYTFVEKEAPPALQEFAAKQSMRFHSVSGSIVPDDHENWERADLGYSIPATEEVPLRYVLGNDDAGLSEEWSASGYDKVPGKMNFGITEAGSRSVYSRWIKMMQEA